MAEEFRVTPAQRDAARGLIELRTKEGKPIDPFIVKVANAKLKKPEPQHVG